MKKHLLKSFAVMVMACGSYAWAYADNVVYGLVGGEPAYSVSFDLDALNPDAATAITKGFSFDDVSEIKTGVTAGDKYYVFCYTTDEESGTSAKSLATLNFTNGKMVVVNNFSYEYGQPGFYTSGMAYDDKNGKLYSMERMYEGDGYVTKLNLIDESKGTMTNVAKFDGEFNAIASDHEGGFYLLKNVAEKTQVYPNLYKVSADYTISEYLTNETVSAYWPQTVSLTVSPDGKTAYAFEGSNVIALDLVAKTAEKKGSLTLDGSAANVMGITYGKGTADGVHNDPPVKKKEQTRFLVKEEYFGDYLGYVPGDVVGARQYYYYNPDGKQVGYVRYGRNANNKQYFDSFSTTNIQKSVFDDDDNLTAKNSYIWGQYDMDLNCWKNVTSSNVNYTYDANGNVATEETGSQLIEYTYNADNTLAKKDTYIKNKISGNILNQSITYSGFDKFGNPTHAVSTGSYDNNKYDADFEYDADGNELSEYQYQTVDGKQKPLMLKTKKYENGILAEYVESNYDADGNEMPNIRYTYTPVNGDPNVICYKNYTYMFGTWNEYGSDIYQYYGDFSDKKDGSKTTLTVQKDETLKNTANLIFDIPQLANFQKCKVVIYRDCQAIDTLNISDIISPTIGKCVYQDKELKNGSYSYFVQPLFAVNNGGIAFIDDPFGGEGDADETEYEGYYSSSAVEVTFDTELPVVTDLKYASGQYTPGSIFTEAKYYANIEWKNPSNAADYGFEKNAVYFTDKWNRISSEAEFTDASVENAQVELTTDVQMQVASFYKYGRVFSDPISVTLKQIEGTTSIETLAGASATIAFNGKNITLSDNANVTVYSANGQQVYSGKNVSSVSLGNMPNGAYIICVEKNGKVNAYKYNAK